MRAALCKSLDGIGSLGIAEIAEPAAGPGQVLVRVSAVGLNFADILMTQGKYQSKPELPFSPGAEIAGVVESFAPGVTGFQAGDRVMAYVGWGGAAGKVAVDAPMLVPVPAGVTDAVASGLSVTFGTALHGLRERGALQRGETVVVTGAAGGAGQAAVEIAKLMGARVIAVASSAEKLAAAKLSGAHEGIQFPGQDLKEAVRSLTDGKGADVVYDCIGGDATEPLVRALAWKGRYLVVGFASGTIAKLPLNLLLVKGVSAAGVFWGEAVRRDPQAHRENMKQLLNWVAEGRLKPAIHAVYPLESIAEAMSVIERREAQGKVVLAL